MIPARPQFCIVRYETKGAHVHVDLWMGATRESVGKLGSLVMTAEEWRSFGLALRLGALEVGMRVEMEARIDLVTVKGKIDA